MKPVAFLVDTDWAVSHLKGVPRVSAAFDEKLPQGLGLSIISIAELWEGILYARDAARSQQNLESFLAIVQVLDLDDRTCRRFGEIRGLLRKRGKIIGDFDILIAATALRHDLTLLTNNRRHFENVPGLNIESL
jgi:tRNA(fMet)-specific endonuclease VapC